MLPGSPARRAALDRLNLVPPPMSCRRLCQKACTAPIDLVPTEIVVLGETGTVMASAPRVGREAPRFGRCPALGPDGGCTIYAQRPFICRFWGVTSWLRCPHGCVPEGGFLDDDTALAALIDWSLIDETDPQQLEFAESLRRRLALEPRVRKALIWRMFVYANRGSRFGAADCAQADAALARELEAPPVRARRRR